MHGRGSTRSTPCSSQLCPRLPLGPVYSGALQGWPPAVLAKMIHEMVTEADYSPRGHSWGGLLTPEQELLPLPAGSWQKDPRAVRWQSRL